MKNPADWRGLIFVAFIQQRVVAQFETVGMLAETGQR
jgi:hypothetical protein